MPLVFFAQASLFQDHFGARSRAEMNPVPATSKQRLSRN